MAKLDFIEKVKSVHGDKYDYSMVTYVNNKTKVTIVCPEHGEFSIRPQQFLKSPCGCPKCAMKVGGGKRKVAQTKTLDDFISAARKVHGNKYDYSKVEYVGNNEKVCIICPEHGEFWQTPHNHLAGYCKGKGSI